MSITGTILAMASQTFPKFSSRYLASSGYTLDPVSIGDSSEFAVWERATAERQDRAWQPIVAAARAGRPREDVAALFAAIDDLPSLPRTVLEVGCGGGYNSELIAFKYPGILYTGLDISAAMIDLARAHYPDRTFLVGSAYALDFPDASVDVVIDGVALLHMPSWQSALREYSRVARSAVILHGLTLTDSAATTKFAKYAYGQPALEFVFNRQELLTACAGVGLTLLQTEGGLDYDLKRYIGIASVSESWVLVTSGS